MPRVSDTLIALIALLSFAGCSEPAARGERSASAARWQAPEPRPAPAKPPPAEARDERPALDAERTAVTIAAYRYELTLHASDADIDEFGAFFLDCPGAQEGEFLAAFARNAPPVRPRRWCRFTAGQAVIDLMSGRPGASFVCEIKDLDLPRAQALATMSWWSDPEFAAGALLALRKVGGDWLVTGYQILWMR